MGTGYVRLRAMVLRYLSGRSKGTLIINLNENGETTRDFKNIGVELKPTDRETVTEILHELYHEGVVIIGYQRGNNLEAELAISCSVTEYGRQVLASQDPTPYDPDGYLARLRRENPDLHPDIIRYVAEALNCFRANCMLASAVMLGCAAEKAILELIETYSNRISDPAQKSDFDKQTRSWAISRRYKALWERLEPMVQTLPKPLGYDLHILLDRVFDLIRTTRNDAGHPSGKIIEREIVHANLILFPSYCRRVYGLIGHFTTR